MSDFHPVCVMASTETLHDKVSATALLEVTKLRDRILRGEVIEFVGAGVTNDENIIYARTQTEHASLRLAAAVRLVHRLQIDMDEDVVPA